MAAITLSMSVASPVRAAAPRVQVDETMYVNMDYYGNMTTVNVVKGCSTNGVERYTDYGVYDKVVNMTDKTEPELGDGSVTWQLPANGFITSVRCRTARQSFRGHLIFHIS